MADTTLAKKLLIKTGHRVLIINAPDTYLSELKPLPDGAETTTEPTGTFDVVQLFARDAAALDRDWPRAVEATGPGGVLWIAWPKQSAQVRTDLNRDILWARLHAMGWDGVTAVSVNAMWSALRFRPVDEVRGGKQRATRTERA